MTDRTFIALDAGGTMTDAVVVTGGGQVALGKALTDYEDEARSFGVAVSDAAAEAALPIDEILGASGGVVYAGTLLLNALLTKRGRRVGLIITRGLEDATLMERGEGAWLGYSYSERLHSVSHAHDEPYIPRRRVRGVRERIDCFGNVIIPLRTGEVREAAAALLDDGVESIAILFLFSYLNPEHEQAAAAVVREVLAEQGRAGVSVVLSSEVSKGMKEYSRLAATTAQAFAAEHAREQLLRVEGWAKDHGYRRNLLTLLAHGGVADVRYPRLYESYVSGPVGGVLGAKFVGDVLGIGDIVCADVGGTSFDVGIIRGGMIPVTREPVLGRVRGNLPTILTESIGAGTGSVLWVDPVSGKLEVGPDSAGSKVGRCYRYPRLTITDCQVYLGYLNPDYFLGGQVKLDAEEARRAVAELAEGLGASLEETAFGAVEYVSERMRQHLTAMLLGRGYNPAEYTLMAYGGGGPLHLWGLAEGFGFRSVLTVPFAAVLSAWGITTADYSYRYHRGVLAAAPPGDDETVELIKAASAGTLAEAWEELEERAVAELGEIGEVGDISLRHYAYVRYGGQLFDHEVLAPKARPESVEDLDDLCRAFEDVYETLYPAASKHSEAGYQILEVALAAAAHTGKPTLPRYPTNGTRPPAEAHKGERPAYFRGEWLPFRVYEMDRLGAGQEVDGPCIVEHPATTLLVPPGHRLRFDERRLIWYE